MNPSARDAAPAPVKLGLFRLTWPLFLEFLLFMLMGTADTLMLSGVSDDAVAAVGVGHQYLFLCILVMEFISHGAGIVVAQYLGAQRQEEAARIAALAITLNLAMGLVISAALYGGGYTLLERMNLPAGVLGQAVLYLRLVGGFLFLQALINIVSSLLRVYGFTRESMFISLGMNVLHIGGNYLLIFGHGGLPALGVTGAAVSTILSRGAALVAFFWTLYRVMDVRMARADYTRFSRDYIRKILQMGIPSAIESVTYHGCQTIFLYYATLLGTAALAARQYAQSISQYVYLFSLAVGLGTSIIVGRLVGAGRPDEAFHRVRTSLLWSLAITVVVDLVAIAFRVPLVSLFTRNPDVLALATQVMVLSLLLETGRAFNLVLVNALRAAGDANFTVAVSLGSMLCMSVPPGYLLAVKLGLGLAGIWLAVAADEWTRGLTYWARWRRRAWEKHALVTPVVAQVPAPV